MRKHQTRQAVAVTARIQEVTKGTGMGLAPSEALSASDLRSRYSRVPDGLKKPAQLAHIIAILGALVDQIAQVPPDLLKARDVGD